MVGDISTGNTGTLKFHLVALLTVAIWGTTFVWTKLLIQSGLSPAIIFTLRFIIAYLLMLAFELACKSRKNFRWMADNWRDELVMVALGVTGGSLYFLTENESLCYTTATNTSLIVCSCPLFTAIAIRLAYKAERLTKWQVIGSLIACLGMSVVVLNGQFVLHLSPIGDSLAFAACLCWAVYSLFIRKVSERYSSIFITRKVFFYGIITIIPYFIAYPEPMPFEVLLKPDVAVNLLFLGCVASMACFLLWNWVMARLGAVKCTNWVYVNPITTIIFAWAVLNETITFYFLIGSALILVGLYLSAKK